MDWLKRSIGARTGAQWARLLAPTLERLSMEPDARCWVPASGDERAALFACLAARAEATTGWLPANGGMLVNLRVWENLVLPASYFGAMPSEVDSAHVEALLDELGIGAGRQPAFCAARVIDLTLAQLRLAAGVRALLARPALLLAESEWFDGLAAPILQRLAHRFDASCPHAEWIVAGDAPPPPVFGNFVEIGMTYDDTAA